MPTNLTKVYNSLLELDHLDKAQRKISLMNIFNRDIKYNEKFCFRHRKIYPTKDDEIALEVLFDHLTTEIKKNNTIKKRVYDPHRSKKLHWIKYHIEEHKKDDMFIFSVTEHSGIRTYIYDKIEKYVIILEPYENDKKKYFLITAYYLRGRNFEKIENKMKRKLPDVY